MLRFLNGKNGCGNANEGINPYLRKGENATIYYNKKNNGKAKYYNLDSKKWRSPTLEEDNGGIRIGSYSGAEHFNINSAWYGDSVFMTQNTDKKANTTMSFYYGGSECAITYAFMSPVPYNIPVPTKNVSKNNTKKSRSIDANRNDTIYFDAIQYIPNTYYCGALNFYQVYKNGYFKKDTVLGNFSIEDEINEYLEVEDVKVYKDNTNITGKFNITVNNNKVVATLKKENYSKIESFNMNYDLRIKCKLKNTNISTAPTIVENGRINGKTVEEYVKDRRHTNDIYLENGKLIKIKNIAKSVIQFNGDSNAQTQQTNIVDVRVMPEVSITVEKTGPPTIDDPEQKIKYKIRYQAKIENYIGDGQLTITDELPYKAKNVWDAHVSNDKKIVYWDTESVKNVNTLGNNGEKIITGEKEFSIIFDDMIVEPNGYFNNKAIGKIELLDPKVSAQDEGICTTTQTFMLDITVKKLWEDLSEHGIERRPKNVQFLLFQNGENTGLISPLIDTTKEDDSYTFRNLPKFDSKGKRYQYTVLEVSKIVENNYYNLKSIKDNLVESIDDLSYYQDFITREEMESGETGSRNMYIDITNKYTSINIKGNVWKDLTIDGKRIDENGFKGVEVQLLIETTDKNQKQYHFSGYNVRTNENGDYEFKDIPWNGTYKIRVLYNGQVYEPTYYKPDLSGMYSNIKEYTNTRQELNDRFSTISSYPNNYDENKRTFGIRQRIKNADGEYNDYNFSVESVPYTFENVLEIFNNVDLNINEYNEDFWNTFELNMKDYGISEDTASKICEYVQDSIILADTPATYSEANLRELKTGTDNTVETVSAGLSLREINDLAITNDVYKVTQIINGKIKEDIHNNKEEIYDVSKRINNNLYNGNESQIRKLYKSDYLYNGSDIEEDQSRNLQVFVTYRTRIKNAGRVSAKINSIASYYDSNYYENIASISELDAFKNNTFIGDSQYNRIGNIRIQESNNNLDGHEYNKLIISGMKENSDEMAPILVRHQNADMVDEILHPGEEADVYITLKVKNDDITNRVFIDKEIKSIVEITGYSTLYTSEDDTIIPDDLDENDNLIKKNIDQVVNAGVVDIDSDPGNLTPQDLDDNDNLVYQKNKNDVIYENMEDDTDKIGLKLTISQDREDVRRIGGFVFEDERNHEDKKLKTSIGNGYREVEKNEEGINGVTLQLVELIPEINENGLAVIEKIDGRDVIKYKRELVIGTYKYVTNEDGKITKEGDYKDDELDNSYFSGNGKSKVIETGDGNLVVPEEVIGNTGEYRFDSIYPGDFYVRFIYGDTVRTTLTNSDNEVNELLKDTEYKGLNAKSYNGQDYKSTIYQSIFDKKGNRIEVDQSGKYYGIDGFGYKNGVKNEGKYDTQNFAKNTDLKDYGSMYYYDLQKSNDTLIDNKKIRLSDAKDIYEDRMQSNLYSIDLTNKNAEVLDSFKKLKSDLNGKTEDKVKKQEEAINELMEKTKMRAYSGVIQLEFAHKNESTSEVDLGLVERAKSQISLIKEVSNIKIVLSNGQVLFDTGKSVRDLYYSPHTEHGVEYRNNKISDTPTINRKNGNATPEIIQAYIDNELLYNANIQIDYNFKVKNIGEVDYVDTKYYYTGLEDDPIKNVVKTKVSKVADYNSNSNDAVYNGDNEKKLNIWKKASIGDLIEKGLITKKYEDELNSYNIVLVTDNISNDTVPEIFANEYKNANYQNTIGLTVQSIMNNKTILNSLIYNNTSEIIESVNSYGRKNAYSIPGNQEITDQRLLINALQGKSKEDRMTPAEIDADSAQKVIVLPPTGGKDYMLFAFMVSIVLGLLLTGLFVVKQLVIKPKNKNN